MEIALKVTDRKAIAPKATRKTDRNPMDRANRPRKIIRVVTPLNNNEETLH
jgi:hypothetical protein